MAKKKTKKSGRSSRLNINTRALAFWRNPQFPTVAGVLSLLISVSFLLAFTSFLIHWKADHSIVQDDFWSLIWDRDQAAKNILGKIGAYLGHIFVYQGFGISSYFLVYMFGIIGIKIMLKPEGYKIVGRLWSSVLGMFWFSALFHLLFGNNWPLLGGRIGYELNGFLENLVGKVGTPLLLSAVLIVFVVFKFKLSPERIREWLQVRKARREALASAEMDDDQESELEIENEMLSEERQWSAEIPEEDEEAPTEEIMTPSVPVAPETSEKDSSSEVEMSIEEIVEEKEADGKAASLVTKYGQYDPRLDLGSYKFPKVDLLNDYGKSNISIDQAELEENKNKIVNTLQNYNIGISQIKATIGPTITLYEIVPEAGIRISKIKNLEDDIALSLSALGIRIIAPIPGKGTIGIEVPNTKKNIVSMRSVIASEKFQSSKMQLPLALGKTISNETFVADLAKMPHLLMAGATGQGKSVGINAILTSLLYKKHPAEVKFVLVDPKKVELTLYNKIERHFLAKLPNEEDAIITDTTKVINTLNSLCIEMDDRYDILKKAMCRNIIEYNKKFTDRKLNPEHGHRYLPYIVLVIDEFADLIMTAGKEVETPIARLAQLARAIGIHLIVATQRPSVNVITGIIKANFPARIAFRVTSKIDSRTILDAGGADQLIGKGDMLVNLGSELIRIQCAFVDTPEVEEITEFIGSQRAYPDAFLLPEYVGEESSGISDISPDERDSLFEEAARVIVQHQQGSTSLIQRKLKLGYNRAGRIIDQLEAAGIVGPFEGSKARQVLVPDEMALEQLLNNEDNTNI
jgi:S-DNA-T family DNA segregation ATPase FtsK/SpoIIIE